MPLNEPVYCVAVAFKMTEQVEQQIWFKFCVKLEHSSVETIWMIQKAFGDDAVSAAQMLQRWSRMCWEWSVFWKVCNKQNTWECWTLWAAINKDQQATDSVRTRHRPGNSKNYYVQDFDPGSWHETCHGKICSMSSATRAEGTSCCSCTMLMTWFKLLPMMLGELCEVPRCLLWKGLRCHCPMYNVSCILYLLQQVPLFFILPRWILSGQALSYSFAFLILMWIAGLLCPWSSIFLLLILRSIFIYIMVVQLCHQ